MRSTTAYAFGLLLALSAGAPARAEFSCEPEGAPARIESEGDTFFEQAQSAWRTVTQSRYTEGNGTCPTVSVPGYEGFPTRRCGYSSADAGQGHFPALAAQVIVLNPSARQLASWSIHACRSNGADDSAMTRCLNKVRDAVVGSNGAQYIVAGSVVESFCNSSGNVPPCETLAANDHNRAPRNTLFRDGVSIGYRTLAHWTAEALSADVYARMFDVAASDADIEAWYRVSRISTAERPDWIAWREHIGKSVVPDGVDETGFDLEKAGWGLVSREVHKSACRGMGNALLDSVVFVRKFAK